MSKNKFRKLRINDMDYGWSVVGPNDTFNETNEVRIWDTDTAQIIDRFQVHEFTTITPLMVVEYIESKYKINKK